MQTLSCFLLTAQGFDSRSAYEITLWGKSADGRSIKIIVNDFHPLFFVDALAPESATSPVMLRKGLPLKSLDGKAVDCLYFATQSQMIDCARNLRGQNIPLFESDVHPTNRYLMERNVFGSFLVTGSAEEAPQGLVFRNPRLRGSNDEISLSVLSFDIETDADEGTIFCVALHGKADSVIMIGSGTSSETLFYVPDERTLLTTFFSICQKEDPDIIIGWNVIDFDLTVIQKRCDARGVLFSLGRDGRGRIIPADDANNKQTIVRIGGRVILDIPVILRSNFHTFDQYSLDFVAAEVLGEHKLITKTGRQKIDEIKHLFATDKEALARYCLEDTLLVSRICEKTEIITEAIERSKRSGAELGRGGGSVAAFDYVYLPRLHKAGYVAKDLLDIERPLAPLSGGYVMESRPGIFENVLILDFKSLYPSLIMTFCIDPLGFATQDIDPQENPYGTIFSKKSNVLPHIIRELMDARARAKAENNPHRSQAVKILMNSFYGVLGSNGCRFFSYDVAQSITQSGQFILKKTIDYIQKTTPYTILYGDTDSLFILLGPGHSNDAEEIAQTLSKTINQWLSSELLKDYDAESALELEFDVHFRHFFMPTIRGSTQGSKKRYCGTIQTPLGLKLMFKGLESARSDWTEIAKEFQSELYMRIFLGQAYEAYIAQILAGIKNGAYDKKLIYKKRLNKSIAEYTTNIPPHVVAASLLDEPKYHISYCITLDGPQPIEKLTSKLDYDHYIETQIKPVADAILERIGTSFDQIISGQTSLEL